jgi:hypothetical protein
MKCVKVNWGLNNKVNKVSGSHRKTNPESNAIQLGHLSSCHNILAHLEEGQLSCTTNVNSKSTLAILEDMWFC